MPFSTPSSFTIPRTIIVLISTIFFSPFLILTLQQSESYVLIWWLALILCVLVTMQSQKSVRLFWALISFYFLIGLLNISTWRGYTDVITIKAYLLALISLSIPFFTYTLISKNRTHRFAPQRNYSTSKTFMLAVYAHLAITYLFLIYIYANNGIVFLNPSLRFGVSVASSYVIKSALPLAAFVPFMNLKRKWLFVLIIILPSLLMSFRGVAILAVLAYIFVSLELSTNVISKASLLKKLKGMQRYLISIFLAFTVIALGFYIRRNSSEALLTANELMRIYFDNTSWWLYIIMPVYLGFKETVGITNTIISKNVENSINDYPLFFADLVTVLPGSHLAAGQSLARMFGSVEAGGLTPGLIGGIYIDYRWSFVYFFLFFGFLIILLYKKSQSQAAFLPVYATVITQFMHLIHRGFLKPEYITVTLIAIFYYAFLRGIRFNN